MTDASFKKHQYDFAAHIRDPEHNPVPDNIDDRRMAIYRELFYNNIEGFVAGGFPVLRSLYSDKDWHTMVREFIARHQSHTPYFLQIAEEFLQFLQDEHQPRECDPPFLLELAHYEWVELALSVSNESLESHAVDPNGDLLQGHPYLSPLAWVLAYHWPVHRISPDYRPDSPPETATHLVVYRDRKDQVRFVLINPVTARLLYLLRQDGSLKGLAALEAVAREMQHPNPEIVIQGGLQALQQLQSQGIILGVSLQ